MENPREKIKSIKNPIKLLLFSIKSETSDSFVNHFDGHFAYLKTLDFYFKNWPTARPKRLTAITAVHPPFFSGQLLNKMIV